MGDSDFVLWKKAGEGKRRARSSSRDTYFIYTGIKKKELYNNTSRLGVLMGGGGGQTEMPLMSHGARYIYGVCMCVGGGFSLTLLFWANHCRRYS